MISVTIASVTESSNHNQTLIISNNEITTMCDSYSKPSKYLQRKLWFLHSKYFKFTPVYTQTYKPQKVIS